MLKVLEPKPVILLVASTGRLRVPEIVSRSTALAVTPLAFAVVGLAVTVVVAAALMVPLVGVELAGLNVIPVVLQFTVLLNALPGVIVAVITVPGVITFFVAGTDNTIPVTGTPVTVTVQYAVRAPSAEIA
jgi:hypothetical protein